MPKAFSRFLGWLVVVVYMGGPKISWAGQEKGNF